LGDRRYINSRAGGVDAEQPEPGGVNRVPVVDKGRGSWLQKWRAGQGGRRTLTAHAAHNHTSQVYLEFYAALIHVVHY
jgi:hypothetical protein